MTESEILNSAYNADHESIDVAIQDQTSPTMIVKFNQVQDTTTLAVETAVGDKTISVVDGSSFSEGSYLIIYNSAVNRYSVGVVTGVSTNTLTIDTPLDAVYPVGATVDSSTTNMGVNGAVTSQVYGVRGEDGHSPVGKTFDITRIIFYCLTATSVDLAKFANITALTNGLVLRRRNGDYFNIFNVKSNAEIAGIMLDWIPYDATNAQQGQYGFTARLTFSGSEKLGVAARIGPDEDLEFIIQDDLSAITYLGVVAEGHEVE